MEQFEQLLTCAICLDRYRNPKLLPCQHSFCMEPCMDGLVDYVKRQVKCPECRAEHRIPYQGVQGYPTNVTLQRFLELHIEITGEMPDPTSGQIMKRCAVCTEKAYCIHCNHCCKDVCPQCKAAHMDILRREITRINNQVRRAIHRLEDILAAVEKNTNSLQVNCSSVSEEVDEIYRRLAKALKDRTDYLRGEVDRYLSIELRNLHTLKDNLEMELANIQANCDLADKYMQSEDVEWEDIELMDTKEIFMKTVDFIRNFEAEMGDYTRRVRFTMTHDPNQLVMHVSTFGDLNISMPHSFSNPTQQLQAGPGLMRSKSDHRLVAPYRQQDERYDREESGRVSPLNGRKFGERYPTRRQEREYDYGGGDYDESSRPSARSRIRSRLRHQQGENTDSDNDTGGGGRQVRFSEGQQGQHKERERVLDTEDLTRGPLSGIFRLYDSPRVMQRLQETEIKKERPPPPPQPTPQQQAAAKVQPPKRVPAAQRQISEEDEITKIKKLMKNAPGEPQQVERPGAERVTALRREEDRSTSPQSNRSSPGSEQAQSKSTMPVTSAQAQAGASSSDESDDSPPASLSQSSTSGATRKTSVTRQTSVPQSGSRRSSASSDHSSPVAGQYLTPRPTASSLRSNSLDSNASSSADTGTTTSSSSASSSAQQSAARSTGAVFTTQEVKRMLTRGGGAGAGAGSGRGGGDGVGGGVGGSGLTVPTTTTTVTPQRFQASSRTTATTSPQEPPRFHSRFLRGGSRLVTGVTTTPTVVQKQTTKEEDEDEETSSEDESSSEETDSDEEPPATSGGGGAKTGEMAKTDIGPLLARSAQARKSSREESSYTPPATSKYGGSYGSGREDSSSAATTTAAPWRTRATTTAPEDDSSSRHTGFTSRFLNKSKSTAAVSPEEEDPGYGRRFGTNSSSTAASASSSSSPRSRYTALKDRKARLARSRSSHNLGDDDDDDDVVAANSPAAYLANKYGSDLSRSRSSHTIKSREPSPERPSASVRLKDIPTRSERSMTPLRSSISGSSGLSGGGSGSAVGEKDGAALSSWARYLKNKYGARGKDGSTATSVSNSRRLSLGLPLRSETSDDDQKNSPASPTSPTQHPLHQGFAVGSSTRGQYAAKRRQVFSVGSRGSEPSCFTWPRGVATGPDNSIVVADSSNHRVQVFDSNGIFQKEFGTYGNGEGEFDCLAGIAVNRIGQFIIADRYNHRIQVMDPSGRFLRAFGSQGTTDGKFNYPWGVTTDALGFIYVCDKENHRVQVFQSDGTFVGKFGSHGSKIGQLDHPHYIAVSNTNRVIVSDSNNHRVQIFDVNGRVISSFGQEGSEEGQFKFPSSANTMRPSSRPYQRSFSGPVASTSSTLESSPQPQPPQPRVVRSMSMTGPPPALSSGSGCGRSRLYPSRGLWEQSDTDLYVGGGFHTGVRLLGERRGRIQRSGGSGSDVQFQHIGLRSGKPPRPGVLRSGSATLAMTCPLTSTIHVFDPLVSKRIMLEATVPYLSPAKRSTHITGYCPSTTASLICQRRMSTP